MALGTRIGAALASAVLVLGIAAAADGSHNIQRGVSLHYKTKAKLFKGRIRSEPPICLSAVVTLHKIKRGPNLTLGSDPTDSDGSWSISRKARRGSFYATAPSYETSSGAFCRRVRSPVLDLG
jgi:hypothetical protein